MELLLIMVVIIWIGLFVFAKQAPKFFRKALGLKEDGGKFFSGIGEAMAIGAAGLGVAGSAAANFRAAREENEQLHPGSGFNGIRNVGSAIAGAIGGGYTGLKALGQKDATARSVIQAQNQRNANRANHSTFPGRVADDFYSMFSGRSLATRDQEALDYANKAFDSLKKLKTTAEEEALKQTNYYGAHSDGHKYNYQALSAALQRARSSGATSFQIADSTGTMRTLNTDELDENAMNDIKSKQATSYLSDQRAGLGALDERTGVRATFKRNGTLLNQSASTDRAVHVAGFDVAGSYTDPDTGVTTNYAAFNGNDYDSIKQTMGRAKDTATRNETNMRNIMHRANSQGKK